MCITVCDVDYSSRVSVLSLLKPMCVTVCLYSVHFMSLLRVYETFKYSHVGLALRIHPCVLVVCSRHSATWPNGPSETSMVRRLGGRRYWSVSLRAPKHSKFPTSLIQLPTNSWRRLSQNSVMWRMLWLHVIAGESPSTTASYTFRTDSLCREPSRHARMDVTC